jgi:hypothetical protein
MEKVAPDRYLDLPLTLIIGKLCSTYEFLLGNHCQSVPDHLVHCIGVRLLSMRKGKVFGNDRSS